MSACIGASAAGVRVFTSSSSHGLALMHEMLHVASYMRMPIVMAVVIDPWGSGICMPIKQIVFHNVTPGGCRYTVRIIRKFWTPSSRPIK